MTLRDTSAIESWHAHIYFDSTSRDAAWAFREQIETYWRDTLLIGRFHERPVGPHPMWSYQLEFTQAQFADVVGWLTLNHAGLNVLIHPQTGNPYDDHAIHALWLGSKLPLQLDVLRRAAGS